MRFRPVRRSKKEAQSKAEIAAFLAARTGIEIDATPAKMRNRKQIVDGISFPSQLQAGYYLMRIKPEIEAGRVSLCLHEVNVPIAEKRFYRVDFVLFFADGSFQFVEAKGFETALWKLKAELFVERYRLPLTVAYGEYQGGTIKGFRVEVMQP